MTPATSFLVNTLCEQQEVYQFDSHPGSHTDDALLNQDHGIKVEITHARRNALIYPARNENLLAITLGRPARNDDYHATALDGRGHECPVSSSSTLAFTTLIPC